MTESMSDERLERLAGLAELPCSCDSADCGNYTSALTAVEARELVAEARRARADAARCQATNESDLYGIIRCDKPHGHADDHEAQTDEAYSKWIRKDAASARMLSDAVARAKRAETELAELRKRVGEGHETLASRARGGLTFPAGSTTHSAGYSEGRRDAYNAAAAIVGDWKAADGE